MTISDHHIVIAELNINSNIKVGRFYWKLNTKLLEMDNIENEFTIMWNNLRRAKKQYTNINEWWESCAKVGIQKFFKKKGKDQSNMRRGLIKYLEGKLHRIYKDTHATGLIDIDEAKRLKDKINNIKGNILEGVKIRARILDQVEGEKASSTLLGK